MRDNDKNLCDFNSDLVIVDDGFPAPKVGVTVRVGITKAVDEPLRYVVAGNPFVSGPALRR